MKGSEIFDAVVGRCLEHGINVSRHGDLFYCAVICMGQKLAATDDDIYREYFEREKVRIGLRPQDKEPASIRAIEVYNEPGLFFKAISYYLPQGEQVLKAHIQVYVTMTAIVPELWEPFGPVAGGRELTKITNHLFGDIINSLWSLNAPLN